MIYLIGARGFVGSAFARYLTTQGMPCALIGRDNYADFVGTECDVLINAAGNSKKYLADHQPLADFDQTVVLTMRSLYDFRTALYVLISSVDVYEDLANPIHNHEQVQINLDKVSNYGFSKYLAEWCVRKHAPRWLIIRLAGMVGPGLKKNPVYDIMTGQPLRIHPDSQYQFMSTDVVAQVVWHLISCGQTNEIFNVCGKGLISPREIATLSGKTIDTSLLPSEAQPRIVNINVEKISRFVSLPETRSTVASFIQHEFTNKGA